VTSAKVTHTADGTYSRASMHHAVLLVSCITACCVDRCWRWITHNKHPFTAPLLLCYFPYCCAAISVKLTHSYPLHEQ
jgi:hypothetical protein